MQILTQFLHAHPFRQSGILANHDLRKHPGQLTRSQSTVLASCGLDVVLDAISRRFECPDVHQVTDLGSGKKGAELVRDDLLRRIDLNRPDAGLCFDELRRSIPYQLEDN